MSIKLRKIEIDSFRAYKDKQIFDFYLGQGKVANLIAIFAPNGFGKTSFFDAVEWSFTGEIDRIEKIPSFVPTQHGNILKNIESMKEFGEIKFVASNNEEFVIRTKKLGLYNRKTDYIAGDIYEISPSFKTVIDSPFSLTNILAHDKIDTFLKFSSQKDRYDTLVPFWDNANDSLVYKKIIAMHIEIERQEQETVISIKESEKEIKQLLHVEKKIKYINEVIRLFNEKAREINLSLNPISDEMSIDEVNKFLSHCHDLKSNLTEDERNVFKNKSKSSYLIEEFEGYNLLKLDYKELDKEQDDITSKLIAYSEIHNNEKELLEINKDLTGIADQIKNLNIIILNYDDNLKIIETIDMLNKDIYEANKSITIYTEELIGLKNVIEKEKGFIIDYNDKYSKVLEDINSIDQQSLDYLESLKHKFLLEKKIDLTKRVLNKREEIHSSYNETINYLETIISYSDEILVTNERVFEQNYLLIECNIINKEIERDKIQLKDHDREIDNYKKLISDIDELKRSGKEIVLNTRTNNCPLCDAMYIGHLELIQKIDQYFKGNTQIDNLLIKKNNYKAKLLIVNR